VTQVFVIVEPGSGVVLDPTDEPTLVLTTCNPRYSSSQRLIVTADRI
jgi:sortase (surface protein transpeptidase)